MNAKSLFPFLAASALVFCSRSLADAPFIDPEDDHKHFGSADNTLFWSPHEKVSGFRNAHRIFPTRTVKAGRNPYPLPAALMPLDELVIRNDGKELTVDDFFRQQNVAGLLVIKDGSIVYERYGLGNDEETRWISFSVSKSVVSMLFGAAIKDGFIGSIDEKVTDYLPRLKGSSYDQSTIENLLQMASGVEWNEDYADPNSDVATASWATLDLYEFLRHKPRAAEPGTLFNYNTAETNLAGTLLRSAIGNNLSTYLSEKIWIPFGMESDAVWNLTEPGGGEFGGCCLSATLRDYARIGLFALHDGRLPNGETVLPEGWMQRSTSPSPGYDGYGYFWWLNRENVFRAIGIFGQSIYINREANVVIAMHSARDIATNRPVWALQDAMFDALASAASER